MQLAANKSSPRPKVLNALSGPTQLAALAPATSPSAIVVRVTVKRADITVPRFVVVAVLIKALVLVTE